MARYKSAAPRPSTRLPQEDAPAPLMEPPPAAPKKLSPAAATRVMARAKALMGGKK